MGKRYLFIILIIGSLFPFHKATAQTSLTLDTYKQKVLGYNQNVQIAQKTIESVREASKEIRTGYFPAIDAAASYNYNFNPPSLALGALDLQLDKRNWSAGGELTQNIFTGGKLMATHKAAKIQLDIANLSSSLVLDNVAYTAEISYWNTSAAKALLDAATQYYNIVNDLYQVVKTRFNDGLISKTDLLKIETSLKDAEYQVSTARQAFRNGCVIMNVLMGADAQQTLVLQDSIQSVLPELFSQPVDSLVVRHPQYLISGKEIDFQKQQHNIDRSEFLPKAVIGGDITYGTPLLNLNGTTLWQPILFAKLSVPIFHWGKAFNARNKNKALIASKELSQSLTKDNLKQEINIALNNMAETKKQIRIAEENIKSASESLDLNTFSYQEGRVSILDVESAQLAWLKAYVNTISSYLQNKLSIADYKKVASEGE